MNRFLQGIACVLSIGIFDEVLSMDPAQRQCKILVKRVGKKLVKKKKLVKTVEGGGAIVVQNSNSPALHRSVSAPGLADDALMNYKDMKNEVNLRYYLLHRLVLQENTTVDEVEFLIKRDVLTNRLVETAYCGTHRYIGQSPAKNWEGNHCGNKEIVNYLFNRILIQKLNLVIQKRKLAEDLEKAKLKSQEPSKMTQKQ